MPSLPSTNKTLTIAPKHYVEIMFKSRHPEMLCKKGVLRNFTKFPGKHLCQSLFFNKVLGLQLYQKRDSGTGIFLGIL